jgi:hypothetical protein
VNDEMREDALTGVYLVGGALLVTSGVSLMWGLHATILIVGVFIYQWGWRRATKP